jgi:tetratricopeptide (TPR) repeat protein
VSDSTNHLRLAYAQLRAKKYDDAVATLTKAHKKFPNRTEITAQLASALSSAKRHAEALGMFEKAAEEARGRNESLLSASLFEMWAFAAERAGQFDKAVELLKKNIENYPDAPGAYNDLGYMWVERGLNLEEAGAFIKKAIELDGDNAAYLDSLGWYYFKTGKFEEAKRELLNALSKMKEEDATVLEHLGDTYEQLGNLREALNQWQRALKLEPENPDKLREKIEAAKKKQGA